MLSAVRLTLIAFICTIGLASAQLPLDQERFADSLRQLLRSGKNDSIKSRAGFALMVYWSSRDTGQAQHYLELGRSLARSYPFLVALSYAQEGFLYYAYDPAKSEAAFLQADTLFAAFPSREAFAARSSIWANVAALHQAKDDDKSYIRIVLKKAIPFGWLAGDTGLVASQYVGVAVALMNIQQHEKAGPYLEQAVSLMRRIHTQPSRLAAAYNRLGENYILLRRLPEARKVLDTLRVILAPYPESELNAGYYMIEGMYYHAKELYNLALASFDKGIAVAGGANRIYRIQELQFCKLQALLAARRFDKALLLLQELSADETLMALDGNRLEVYSGFASAYAGTDQKGLAYEWEHRSHLLSDSLQESRLKDAITEMELQYRNSEKEKEISQLKADKKQAALAAANNRLLIILLTIAALLFLLTAVIAWLYFRNKKKLAEQQQINYRQQLTEMAQRQQLATAEAMLEGEERERRRMARDLHDGLGSMLAGVKIRLSAELRKGAGTPELDLALSQLDASVSELRRIARNMMPESLARFGLQTALKDLCDALSANNTQIRFEAYGVEESLPLSRQVVIYRIIQEALTNAVRHAHATDILLQCSQNGSTFLITVEDNGTGFDTADPAAAGGMGMGNIANRVKYLRGILDISSAPGEGTTINIELNVSA